MPGSLWSITRQPCTGRPEGRPAFPAARIGAHRKSLELERERQRIQDRGIVIHDQDDGALRGLVRAAVHCFRGQPDMLRSTRKETRNAARRLDLAQLSGRGGGKRGLIAGSASNRPAISAIRTSSDRLPAFILVMTLAR